VALSIIIVSGRVHDLLHVLIYIIYSFVPFTTLPW